MKKNNPYIPIMIREASGTEPRVWARYEFGREKMEDLRGIPLPLLQQYRQYAQ
jgi:NADH dehydrogenase (ubiquinone) 1 alpha subcomplex subunit 2